jgi:Ca2+-transporting ATPase
MANAGMDTMAALDPQTDAILDRPPHPKSAPLITLNVSAPPTPKE